MTAPRTIRVAVNGYGVIGKRVAGALADLLDASDIVVDCTPQKGGRRER